MIHIRIDNEAENSKRRFACGIGPDLPEGDKYFFAGELHATPIDCPICNPNYSPPPRLSEISGRPGHPGYEEFCRIARSWGYD